MFQYGFIVATDAFAQLLFAPFFGWLADKLGTIRPVAITCSVIFTIGNLLYSMISIVPQTMGSVKQARFVAMLVARFIVGMGTGV
jgi:MFS family permease